MRVKKLLVATALIAASSLVACSGSGEENSGANDASGELPADYSGLMDAYTATFNSLTEAVEGLKGEADVKEIGEELKSQLSRLQEIQAKLGTIPADQSPDATEKNMAMMGAMNQFKATVKKMMENPAFAKSLQEAMRQVAAQQ